MLILSFMYYVYPIDCFFYSVSPPITLLLLFNITGVCSDLLLKMLSTSPLHTLLEKTFFVVIFVIFILINKIMKCGDYIGALSHIL